MSPKFIDIHSHLHFAAFDADREEALVRAKEGHTWVINVGTQRDTSANAVALAQNREGVFATVGLHPIHTVRSFHDQKELGGKGGGFTSRGEEFDTDFYRLLAQDKKVVAIGECGLDYYRLEENTIDVQKKAFQAQINLANEIGKPLMLHIRNPLRREPDAPDAYRDAFGMLEHSAKVKGNVHFFAGTWEQAQWFLNFGFTLSFTGVITFTHDYDDVVRRMPPSMILSETDSPYITPVPHRGTRNESIFVKEVVQRIAEILGNSLEIVAPMLVANAIRVFSLSR